jgi:hypothetical protein
VLVLPPLELGDRRLHARVGGNGLPTQCLLREGADAAPTPAPAPAAASATTSTAATAGGIAGLVLRDEQVRARAVLHELLDFVQARHGGVVIRPL